MTKAARKTAKATAAALQAEKPSGKTSSTKVKSTAPAEKPKARSALKPAESASVKASAARKPATAQKPPRQAAAKPAAGKAPEKPATKPKAPPASATIDKRPWLKSYPKGVPAEIAPLEFGSIGDLLVNASKKYAARPAFTSMGKTISFAELERLSAAFGAYLQSKGLAKGARVALMMPNVLQYPVAMLGVLRAGYTVVNVNPLYTPRELEHQLKDSGAEAIVILENFAATLQAALPKTPVKHVVVAAMGDMLGLKGAIVNLVVRRVKKMVPAWSLPGHVKFPAALKQGSARTFKPVKVGGDDIAFLQYTGGTTGVSKGATLLHRNVLANVAQLALWVEDAYTVKPKPQHLTYICALPLYHIFALTVNALMGMQQGAHNILIPNPRDIPAFIKELKKYPFHILPGLNTLFNALLNNEEFRKLDFKPLILTLGGGMAVQRAVAERWKALTGNSITEGYGLSETSPVATANRVNGGEFTGTIGLPIPSTEIAIRDEKGRDLPLGEVGEICIKGPQVMAGYWKRPDETANVMSKDGFFKSGDMGFLDERGYTKIVDRKKDMILVSGFNVYPNELEDVAAQHPGVLEVAAIGVPDEHSGEVPKLFVVRKDPNLTAEDLLAYCKQNLTGYKRPRLIEFRDELPKTPVGKILRRELRG
ncbi:long-chain-fatty-acid--CoA ligase [Pseudaminobacter arsenicus]|uniref:Long-chain-fatty-acid--CoA ligase n=1 Tax=Borborobacter arsenicus TaxID=1851146 RepID=A0A432V9L0_9HYPH|nr:long-chain-fatty-acid--CoA ligase [Pseudaminobacter arsenicus]RUM98850.1 long-chain-fatty-acid--CoA ligase [Pseudaminobacter arsenicus]